MIFLWIKDLEIQCSVSEDGENNAFARVNDSYTTEFNASGNGAVTSNSAIGYMFSSNTNSDDYDIAQANDNDSTILSFLKAGYDEKLRSYNDQIADVVWCNDKKVYSGTVIGSSDTRYQALWRMDQYPSLLCPLSGSDGKLFKFTARDNINGNAKLFSSNQEYKIGMLTIDEIHFAGYAKTYTNSSSFIFKNASGSNYWTLSPGRGGFNLIISNNTTGTNYNVIQKNAVRPSIALKSSVTITSGDGTSENPYIVS